MPFSRRVVLGSALVLPAARARAQPDPLPLGALFPFSGMFAQFGDESYRGLELATDERNGAGGLLGRPIKLVKGDAVDPNTAVTEVKRLLGTEKAGCVFGTFSSSLVLAASQITELAGIPYFELDASAEAVVERGFHFLFRTCAQAGSIAALSVDTILATLAPAWGADRDEIRVGILHEDGLYGSTIGAAQLARCTAHGLHVTDKLAYSVATTDLSSAVQRLRGADSTVVLHTGFQNDTVLLYRQMKQAVWFPRMVIGTGGGYALSDTAATIGADFEGTLKVGVPPYALNPAIAPGLQDVEAAYERRYGGKPRSGDSLASYVGARIFFEALSRAGSLDKDKIRAAVLATHLDRGTTSNGWGARFDDKGQNLRSFPVLAQWAAGVLRTVAPDDAAAAKLRPKLGA